MGKRMINNLLKVVLALAILATSVLFNVSCQYFKSLTYDYVKGEAAFNRVETAQYLPDINLLFTSSVQPTSITSQQVATQHKNSNETIVSNTEFIDIVNEYATIENYSGSGKYLGYDIYEIKEEIAFVVKMVPAFNQWFRMPTMREEQGFISTPYYENWAYYLEMDDAASKLSITRVCWNTRSSYYDFDKGIEVEDYPNGASFVQYEVMKINYYFNSDGDEVVDCYIHTVGLDNNISSSTYNKNTNDYHPFEYIYLQNVKDKSLTKYHITAAERTQKGMDIRGLYPYGYRREFTLVDYAGYGSADIELLQIDQYASAAVYFNLESNNIVRLVNNIGLSQEEYASSTTAQNLLDKICVQIVDNFELKNNWAKIYKESVDAYKIDMIKGPIYGQSIPINLHLYVSCREHDKRGIEFSAHADVLDLSQFDTAQKYSLSMALKSRETGNYFIVGTDYRHLAEVEYNYPQDYQGVKETYYRTSSYIDITSFTLSITEPGEYDVICLLTIEENGKDIVVFDTLQTAYLRQYHGLIIPSYTDSDGVEYSYTVSGISGKLTITVKRVQTLNDF